jgi:hypothetical protein
MIYQVHIMRYVPYVGFVTYGRPTVMTRFMFYKRFVQKERVTDSEFSRRRLDLHRAFER